MIVNKENIKRLATSTGCSMEVCKKAIEYCNGRPEATPVGYLKALSYAVATPCLSFDDRVLRFSRDEVTE